MEKDERCVLEKLIIDLDLMQQIVIWEPQNRSLKTRYVYLKYHIEFKQHSTTTPKSNIDSLMSRVV